MVSTLEVQLRNQNLEPIVDENIPEINDTNDDNLLIIMI